MERPSNIKVIIWNKAARRRYVKYKLVRNISLSIQSAVCTTVKLIQVEIKTKTGCRKYICRREAKEEEFSLEKLQSEDRFRVTLVCGRAARGDTALRATCAPTKKFTLESSGSALGMILNIVRF